MLCVYTRHVEGLRLEKGEGQEVDVCEESGGIKSVQTDVKIQHVKLETGEVGEKI